MVTSTVPADNILFDIFNLIYELPTRLKADMVSFFRKHIRTESDLIFLQSLTSTVPADNILFNISNLTYNNNMSILILI